jgi:hypothetical protein
VGPEEEVYRVSNLNFCLEELSGSRRRIWERLLRRSEDFESIFFV